MKLSLTSRLCAVLGHNLIGRPASLFGIDVPHFWTMSYDVPHPTLDEADDPAWLELRIAYAYLRRHMLYRVGWVTTGMLSVFVLAVLIAVGSITATKAEWQKHEAAVAVEEAQAQAAKQAAEETAAVAARKASAVALLATYCSLPSKYQQNNEAPTCGSNTASDLLSSIGMYYAASAAVCAAGRGSCDELSQFNKDVCAASTADYAKNPSTAQKPYCHPLSTLTANIGKTDYNGVVQELCADNYSKYCEAQP